MRFELSVALKYLLPRWKQLSVSIISMVSILVISLVVWLILVFFSVTNGLEKNWTEKIVALTSPVRIIPTDHYFKSYYYQVDSFSQSSNYSTKTIGEKLAALESDPYNPLEDEEIPSHVPAKDLKEDGTLRDPVKEAFAAIKQLGDMKGICANDFQMTFCTLKLKVSHPDENPGFITQSTYLGSYEPDNALFKRNLLENNLNPGLPKGSILLPKGFREAGVKINDTGYLGFYAATTSSVQEQRVPVTVAGFYDPGIMPIGGKFIIANKDLTTLVRSSQNQEDSAMTNGINVRFDDIAAADEVKARLEKQFSDAGIDSYWKIQTFRDFDFTKDLLQQMQSDKVLFLLIATIIIVVACSNIVSMLIILVNDKKKEIGILQSMGATSLSIGTIFGLCGMIMGLVGSAIGFVAALFTLSNLQSLVQLLSNLQGHNAFNPVFYGDTLPNQISGEALVFVAFTTGIISLLAGIVPAWKASCMNPSEILRSE